ncbi:UNVERIFIED_CONTAM: hypothetical protein K2H54_002388 [Gekko kuhli]
MGKAQAHSFAVRRVSAIGQITTLINHKDKPKRSDRTLKVIQQVGQAVNLAVGRFVTVGEAIANENQELKEEMNVACIEAKRAGETIAQLTDVAALDHPESDGQITIFTDKTGVVFLTMEQLEKVSTFQEFVQIFSQFGNEMVEFAHLTGDRQNDLKDEKKKAKMAAARAVLEKCTMMLLTASKTCLRHPDCESARLNKGAVFHRVRLALEHVVEVVTDSCPGGEQEPGPVSIYAGIKEFKNKVEGLRDSLYLLSKESLRAMLHVVLEHTEDFTDSAYTSHENRERILELSQQAKMELEQLLSAWTYAQSQKKRDVTEDMEVALLKTCQCMNELQREVGVRTKIQKLQVTPDSQRLHLEHPKLLYSFPPKVARLLQVPVTKLGLRRLNKRSRTDMRSSLLAQESVVLELHDPVPSAALETASLRGPADRPMVALADHTLLECAATSVAADLLKYHSDHLVLKALKASGEEGNIEAVAEHSCKLSEQKEQLLELCRLLRHVSGMEPLEITCLHAEDTFKVTGPQIISAAETLTLHPSSKIAKENLEVFCEAWESQLSDMSLLLREISDVFEGRRGEKRTYLSLPRPGKHNTNLKTLKPVRLDSEEQAALGKPGLTLCELSSRVDSEMEKWDDPESEIVRRGQCLSSMAYSMYLFTRGEGLLKTTQDLFQQAEAFATEGLKLVSALLAFSNQLEDDDKPLLLQEIEKMVSAYRQLQAAAQAHVQGKSAVFTKVDTCIQEARHILNVLVQVLPLSCKLLRKHRVGNGYLRGHRPWRENGFHATTKDDSSPSGNTDSLGIRSLKQRVADLTLLEN